MTNTDVSLNLQQRTVSGKNLGAIRKDGLVPAVIHNHGQASILVMAPENELGKIYKEAGKHHPLNLKVADQDFLALIKEVHIHPVKRRIDHVVFQAIRTDEKVEAEIPIHLEGEIPAEKVGLMVLHQLDHVNVEALPKNLPDALIADASKLVELHDKITVADLQVPDGVTVLTEADHPIVVVVETKAMISEEELAAEAEAAEGEAGEAATEGEATEGGEAKDGAEKTSGDKEPQREK